jgi:hypothetical protein
VHDGGYIGIDVHRAARKAASGHGGRVVLSSVTAELARRSLRARTTLRDLGIHHLKDIAAPEHLWQLDIEGLQTDFRPLRTIGATSRLPMTATRLVGHDEDVTTLVGRLREQRSSSPSCWRRPPRAEWSLPSPLLPWWAASPTCWTPSSAFPPRCSSRRRWRRRRERETSTRGRLRPASRRR